MANQISRATACMRHLPRIARCAALIAGAWSVVGCRSADAYNRDRRAELVERAQFEMQCPQNQLHFTVLRRGTEGGRRRRVGPDIVTSYGVTGCGRRTVYVLEPDTATWLANTSGGEEAAAPAP
ncbi:hypothetical protein [Sandaracinus amylolyticus]|nr:hypothetical protein [Sandaracinus amylolyticus]